MASLDRRAVSKTYLSGQGIEIGALHQPLQVGRRARVRYVDRLPVPELRRHYPELAGERLVPVDVIDDGERLLRFENESLDFIIANHMIEHCENPIATLLRFFEVLKPQGMLYLAIPDKRFSFDRDRPITPLRHLLDDYERGPEISRDAHFREWAEIVQGIRDPEQLEKQVQVLREMNYSIHFHVWTQREMMELFDHLRSRVEFEIEAFLRHDTECIFLLRKGAFRPI